MKGKELEVFAKSYLIEALPGFVVRGRRIIQLPVGYILRAILFDSSSYSKAQTYPHVFVQPLYIPSAHLTLSYGRRLAPGGVKFVQGKEQLLGKKLLEGIREHGFPLFDSFDTPEKFVANAQKWSWFRLDNPHNQWALALSFVLTGDIPAAKTWIRSMRSAVGKKAGAQAWEIELLKQASEFELLLDQNPKDARQRIDQWTSQTRKALRLPD
jgi:hypothetical protein